MRNANGVTSRILSVGIFSPLSWSSSVSALEDPCAVLASFARSAWLVCAERATEKNRSIGTEFSGLPNILLYHGKYQATAHVLLCRT